jgi:cell division protein FtsI/penicillin-binding protein 2
VHTTLDVDLQRFAEETLINAPPEFADPYGVIRGAIVVLDADTGAVLALASTPRYDPSVFTKHGSAYIRQRMALLGLDEQGEEKPEEGDPEAGANVAEVREAMVEDVNPEVLAAEDGADGAAGGQSAASPGAEGAASQPEAAREAPPQAADAETEGRGGAETAPEQSAGASGRNNEGIRVDDFPKAAPASPMFNRCYEGIYPPGSVYKVLMALVALEEGVVTPETTFYCGGLYRMPGVSRPWRCHKRSGHGQVNMIDALTVSCDVYFYNVGQRLADTAPEAADMLHAYAKKLGLGVETGLDIPGERAGLIPSQAWKVAMDKQENADYPHDWGFFPGHILNMSIGQGDVLMTPLQGATLVAAVVNGGRRIRPYLNRALEPDRTAPLFSSETVEVVRRAMLNCVERDHFPSGTGRRAKIEGLDIIGKTGTAQVVAISHYKDLPELEQPYQIRDHAWFVAGVLNREPRIAVSVVVEHGLHGGSTASILARDVIEYFYKRDDERRDVKLARGEAN